MPESDLYFPHEESITITSGAELSRNITLRQNFGTLKITSNLEGYTVFIEDRQNRELSSGHSARLKPGRYKFRIEKENCEPVSGEVFISRGATEIFSMNFVLQQGRIIAYTTPSGADIRLLDERGQEIARGETLDRIVPVGPYRLIARLSGYRDVERRVEATDGFKEPIKLEFSQPVKEPKVNDYVATQMKPPSKTGRDQKDRKKWYKKWWVWTIGVAVVGGGVYAALPAEDSEEETHVTVSWY
ncbi:hypothetical protein ACFL27_21960 [candidate division CSSED10-310 bacterium]|uniref:PEGA domain-containing protein n=1 Tax=candidate division CSSED10-310 bacterium TaxID=2855610 RepID=A0ABV6Z354_UNCC1